MGKKEPKIEKNSSILIVGKSADIENATVHQSEPNSIFRVGFSHFIADI